MPKFFVTSDIHSFYTPFKKALDEKCFDPNNENHWLIVCGDCFDRGDESKELLKYLMSLDRKILIKGNHDILLEDCCMREFPYSYDKHNGTTKTIKDLGGYMKGVPFGECCQITWNRLARYRELLVNYFETEHFIFCHSLIPTISQNGSYHKYDKNWRNATNKCWELAMWGNPFELADLELNQTGKTIVFGHWHCSTGHSMLHKVKISEFETESTISEFEDDAIWEPCYFKNTIGIDRCTAYTSEVNVLVIEDEFMEGYYENY